MKIGNLVKSSILSYNRFSQIKKRMDDATLLRNTKSRLNGSKKLKDWAIKSVLSNLDVYTPGQANDIKTKLSPELRDYILQELLGIGSSEKCNSMEEFTSIKRSMFVLMNTRTYKLDLDILMSFYPSNLNPILDFIEVLSMVSISAPNMRHLKMNIRHFKICLDCIEFRNASLKFLSYMKELRILEIVGLFDDKMDLLALLCRKLPNLRVLSAPDTFLERTKLSEENIRLSFGHLRLLHINISSFENLNKIWMVLPNLDIIYQNILPNGLILEDFLEDENMPREHFFSIRYLELFYDESSWDEFKKTPNLPSTLEGLTLIMLYSQETVEAVLLKYGANLRWLSLRGNGYQSVDLNRISDLCPKLEVLSLTSVQVARNAAQQINFHHLKELFTERVDMLDGSLTALLSLCPNLRNRAKQRNISVSHSKTLKIKVGHKMEFDAMLNKSKWLLQKSKKMKDLALETVIRNLSRYIEVEGVNYIQSKLCPEMRDFVLQELLRTRHPRRAKTIEEFISIKRSVLALINIRTKKLDLDVLMSFHLRDSNSVYEFNEVLMMVSIAAPNIQHLKMNIAEIKRCFANDAFQNTIMSHLKSLKELRIVEIKGHAFHLEDLFLFCRELSNLRALSVSRSADENMTEYEIIQTFGHLSLLEYRASQNTKKKIWKVLPHLDIVDDVKNYGLTLEDFLDDDQAPRTRKLFYYDRSLDICTNIDLSSSWHLAISHLSSTLIKDMETLNATTLEGLTLKLKWSGDSIDPLLLKYGSNLRKLFLAWKSIPSPGVQLNRISELCPKLEALHLQSVDIDGKNCKQTTFRRLTELKLCSVNALNDDKFLSTVLQSAPNLTKLYIFGQYFNHEDLREVMSLIIEKKILRSLKYFHWKLIYPCFPSVSYENNDEDF
ncbi:Hypothetical predicted protein [Cloeon dipterum]|uniref:Uncharacterized protein n=1 Tax=Cloeon dipterum TaxID=197152 RepID=A0A8S1DMC3_9INSE|nr:Hypothetical predicted protein [Cloeon dipterum]